MLKNTLSLLTLATIISSQICSTVLADPRDPPSSRPDNRGRPGSVDPHHRPFPPNPPHQYPINEFDYYLRMSDYELGQYGFSNHVGSNIKIGACLKSNPQTNIVQLWDRDGTLVFNESNRFDTYSVTTRLGQSLRGLILSQRCSVSQPLNLTQYYLDMSDIELAQHGLKGNVGDSYQYFYCQKWNYTTNRIQITDQNGVVVFDRDISRSPQDMQDAGRALKNLLNYGMCGNPAPYPTNTPYDYYLGMSDFDLGQHGITGRLGDTVSYGRCTKDNYARSMLRITDGRGYIVFDQNMSYNNYEKTAEAGRTLKRLMQSGQCR